ncbi:hypothetical protein AB6A40_007966 [Gnathostoma spinigerum]|uniref:Large ribosomal subunit protein uL3m n=1 Tax=Gnathostoma spinigerum TaxID=75299 RepID=A0ABD6EX53_9BILA
MHNMLKLKSVIRAIAQGSSVSIGCEAIVTSVPNLRLIQVRGRRRTLRPPPWAVRKNEHILEFVEPEVKDLMSVVIAREIDAKRPLITSDIPESAKYSEKSRRVGLLGRKIGMLPQWLNDGTRVLCTMLEIPDNQVVGVVDPDTWYKNSLVGKRKAYGIDGPMWKVTVGAVNGDPREYTHEYIGMFERRGIPVKEHFASFMVTEDAVLEQSTPLYARHFLVGQYVTVTGKTIDWGFQGGMHRWGMKGMPALNTTKSHRRIGSIGSTGDARVWPGKRMPGHMGYEWVTTSGLQILRINPAEQVIYLKGCVPGDIGEMLLIKDCLQERKRAKDLPFPTFIPEKSNEKNVTGLMVQSTSGVTVDENGEMFAPNLFR